MNNYPIGYSGGMDTGCETDRTAENELEVAYKELDKLRSEYKTLDENAAKDCDENEKLRNQIKAQQTVIDSYNRIERDMEFDFLILKNNYQTLQKELEQEKQAHAVTKEFFDNLNIRSKEIEGQFENDLYHAEGNLSHMTDMFNQAKNEEKRVNQSLRRVMNANAVLEAENKQLRNQLDDT